jgi:penicillin-binding protein 1A
VSREGLLGRVREERRVRRDFEQLLAGSGLAVPDTALRGRAEPKPPLWRRGWKWWLSRGTIALITPLVLLAAVAFLAPLPYDPPAPLQTAFVFDSEGRLIARVTAEERRTVVPLRRIPEQVRQAFLAAEDERFYRHMGVDPIAILRALWEDLTGGRFQGGSTITQQLVRNTSEPYVGRERTLWRKLREAVMAVRLERRFSKDEILEMYLNQIYFGEGAYGVEAASQEYFGTHVWNLDLAQAATLAGSVAAPSRYNPRASADAATERRDWVLQRMVTLNYIEPDEAGRARAEDLKLAAPKPQKSRAAYFVDYLTRDVRRRLGADVMYRGGLQIESTLDLEIQRAAERAIAGVLNQPGDPAAALVAVDVRTGGILAMVGGRDFHRSQVNLATGQGGSGRQAGSAFKPFVLARALQEGISPYDVYSAPGSITVDGWDVSNFGGSSYGALSVRSATVSSVNTVFAQLVDDVGADDVADLAHRMGIRSELPPVLSLALGSAEVTPLEMTAAYATLASGGIYRRPSGVGRIVDSRGEVVQRLDSEGRRALDEDIAGEVTDILLDVVAGGTGSGAQLSSTAVAGKTGTSQDYADSWFCGYTSEVAACVWMGHVEARIPMTSVRGISVTGGSFPADIWQAFMSTLPSAEESLGTGSSSSGASTGTYTEPETVDEPAEVEKEEPEEAPAEPSPPPPPPAEEPTILPPILPPAGQP